MINYSKFVSKLALAIRPIYELPKTNNSLVWSKACDKTLEKMKDVIA